MDSPTEKPAPTRDRILQAASVLLRRQGYDGTGVKQIARDAEATLGSLYHFFPDGKEQLAAEALRGDAEHYADLLRNGMAASADPADGIAAFAHLLADELRTCDWWASCLASAAALEQVGRQSLLQQGYAEAQDTWRDIIADRLRAAGVADAPADDAACFALSALEGAEVQSRATRNDSPLRSAATHLAALFAALPREGAADQ
ncbi:TetR/AcrR family transcriptional regulator [Nocardiopsis coralliicola]